MFSIFIGFSIVIPKWTLVEMLFCWSRLAYDGLGLSDLWYVAVDLTKEEWTSLNLTQEILYKDVMLVTYKNLSIIPAVSY